jgi:hypothetical protein
VKDVLLWRPNTPLARFGTRTVMMLGLVLLLLWCGRSIAVGNGKLLLVAAAAAGLFALARIQRGAFIGILLLAAMNGLPFIDTSPVIISKLTIADVAVLVLVLTACAWIASSADGYRPNRASRTISRIGVLLLLWWMWTIARTVTDGYGPLTRAADYGRDVAFFALLLIVLPRVRLRNRDIGVLLGVLTAGVCLFAVGQVMIATGLGRLGTLIHFRYTLSQSGVTRVYADMTDLVGAGLAVSVMACLVASRRTVRLIAFPVALLLTTSTVVQLTRARWIGLVVAFVIVTIWLMVNGDARVSPIVRRRLTLTAGMFGLAGVTLLLITPGIVSSGTVTHRLLSIFTDTQNGVGTIGEREAAAKTTTAYLGGEWPGGLGFISPTSHYFLGLPEGSIRDSDIGVLSAVATMGVVGVVLVYAPVMTMLIYCLRRARASATAEYSWLRYGGAVWILAALVSSLTLVTLFSASGLVLTAVFLTVLASPSVLGERAPSASTTSSQSRSGPMAPRVRPHPLTT